MFDPIAVVKGADGLSGFYAASIETVLEATLYPTEFTAII
jgi:hypothetical protein